MSGSGITLLLYDVLVLQKACMQNSCWMQVACVAQSTVLGLAAGSQQQ